jgi:hypothetical protein
MPTISVAQIKLSSALTFELTASRLNWTDSVQTYRPDLPPPLIGCVFMKEGGDVAAT